MNQIAQTRHIAIRAWPPLRVTMLGIRGFPDVQGGAEKHAEKLACELVALGCDVEVIMRSGYVAKKQPARWRNIKISRLWAPQVAGVEALLHTLFGVLRAAATRPDILHIHAIGPALFTPLARALGLRVVVTHHVVNYENEKWGSVGRSILRLGEWAGMKFANGRIAVSENLAKQIMRAYRVPISAIPNGIEKPRRVQSTASLATFGLSAGKYVLAVARIDEQKRQLDVIAAYARLGAPAWKLVLVGGADYSGKYAREVAEVAKKTAGVVMLGHQSGDALAELYTHAGVFVLPSSHEGQPIAVLEAASYGLPLVLSDIAAHREIGIPRARYFSVGDIAALTAHLQHVCSAPVAEKPDTLDCARLMDKHDWGAIAQRTLVVYREALSGSRSGGGDRLAARIGEFS